MNLDRLEEILGRFRKLNLCVFGDFVLHRSLDIDPAKTETSPTSGIEVHQVTAVHTEAGAAGRVVNNLCALGVGAVRVVSCIGGDGEGFELARELARFGAETSALLESPQIHTPTFTKPVLQPLDGAPRPLARFDTANLRPLPEEIQDELLRELRMAAEEAGGVVVFDYVRECDFGVVTDRVRAALSKMALEQRDKLYLARSRARVSEFTGLATVSTLEETAAALHKRKASAENAEALSTAVRQRTNASAYLTLGNGGTVLADRNGTHMVAGYPVHAVEDVLSAADAATAGIAAALAAGASRQEAAIVGNLAAAVTTEQVGTSGVATQKQLLARLWDHLHSRGAPPAE